MNTAKSETWDGYDRRLDDGSQVEAICHDLKQHIATGLLLTDPESTKDVDMGLRRRFEMLHQQWEDAAELVAILSREALQRTTGVDLAEMAAACIEPIRTQCAVVIEVGPGQHVVASDRVLVRRAIANLLDNACRATPTLGKVQVVVGSEGPQTFIEVIDEGPGFGLISSGAGLGLQIVRTVVWRSGGNLRIETGPRGGTSVRMSFPTTLQVVS